MKSVFLTTVLVAATTVAVLAQEDKSKRPSPPAKVSETINGKTITIDYAQPAAKGRNVWDSKGSLAPYGKVWRTGANEATVFETSKDLTVEGKALPAGKYALFTIPGEKEWTVIFNKKADQWGAYDYKESDDALRVKVPAKKAPMTMERFTIKLDKKGTVGLFWADAGTEFKVK